MEIITDLKFYRKNEYPNLVVALGNFDGVHLGHREILKAIKDRAAQIDGVAAVFTFKDHPQRVLHQKEDPPILTSVMHKLFLLEQAALDLCFLIDFTIALSEKSPQTFVREVLVEALGAKQVCLGFNARFGHDRMGDSAAMGKMGDQFGFKFFEMPPFRVGGQVVSSTLIRSLVREGKLEEAQKLLGRPYSFFGTVVPGSGRGKDLGFPTANLDPHSEVMPPEGVYAAWVRVLDCELSAAPHGRGHLREWVLGDNRKALLNYGKRPTFGTDRHAIPEVHILDFHEGLVNKTIEVTVGTRLRPERTFSDSGALRDQIRRDIEAGQKWFAEQALNGR